MLPYSLFLLMQTIDTARGKFSVPDSPSLTLWDDGQSRWNDFSWHPDQPLTVPPWGFQRGTLRTGNNWDEAEQTHWDGGLTRWTDQAPGWDAAIGTTRRTWVVAPAGPFGANVWSQTNKAHTARMWTRPKDDKTAAKLTRRALVRDAVAAWKIDPEGCIESARENNPGHYWSEYHRFLSYYLKTH